MPRSMPMCQVQLNSTDFKSLLPSAGVYGGGLLPPNCAFATTDMRIATANASATLVEVALFLKAMLGPPIPKIALLVGLELEIAPLVGLELDRLRVRQRNRPDESQWLAVSCREVADRHGVPLHDRVGPAAAEAEARQDVGGTGGQYPLGLGAVLVHLDMHGPVRIGERDPRDDAGQLTRLANVVYAGERVMRQRRTAGEKASGKKDGCQSPLDHFRTP